MNLEINIKVPLGAPEVSIEQETSGAARGEELILPPPPPPESLAHPETPDATAERLRPYWEPLSGAEESGNGGRREGEFMRADDVGEAGPPSPEELGIEARTAADVAPPPDPSGLERGSAVSAVPPGLEEINFEGLKDQEGEALPPSIEELESMAAEPEAAQPSAKTRKRTTKAKTKSNTTRKKPDQRSTKATEGEANES